MSYKVLILGAGGVSNVVTHKCAMVPEVFATIVLASRRIEKCDKIAASVNQRVGREIVTEQVDAMDVSDLIVLIKRYKIDLVINVALPGQDLTTMAACLETGAMYLDTANYEPPHRAEFRYEWQWGMGPYFEYKQNMALLGCGFDPGATNAFIAYIMQGWLDHIHNIDIVDCNAGEHGYPFATNFHPETNIREVTKQGGYWENGRWIEFDPIINPTGSRRNYRRTFRFPEVGEKEMFAIYHEEMQSLVDNIPGLKRIRFWMTFGPEYLTHLRVLNNVGLTRIDPIVYNGVEIIPLQFTAALLPDPSSLAQQYTGKTCIGCRIEGLKDGKPKKVFIYNVCDHAECYREVGSQAISYTTGVPAVAGAIMMLTGQWSGDGVFNVEQFPARPFLEKMAELGLPWKVLEDEDVPDLPD